ncbi:MAG: hypothetical protein HYT11_02080 [Candidatus Levybacteria bacterium]|nr:hypothetical protein [Candidatus Levybacteria bacterium]
MSERVTGYILLGIGICIMLFALGNIYLLFTSKIQPIHLFDTKGISLDINSLMPQLPEGVKLEKKSQGAELISSETINQTLNLSAHFFLMSFVMTFGYKLASLGVMLVRPVVVKLKEAKEPPKPQ